MTFGQNNDKIFFTIVKKIIFDISINFEIFQRNGFLRAAKKGVRAKKPVYFFQLQILARWRNKDKIKSDFSIGNFFSSLLMSKYYFLAQL